MVATQAPTRSGVARVIDVRPQPVVAYERTKYGNLVVAQIKAAPFSHWNGMIFEDSTTARRVLSEIAPDREFVLLPFHPSP